MEALSVNDKQGMEICENVGQILVEELDSEDAWNRIEQMLPDYLKNNNINMVKLFSGFFGGDSFGGREKEGPIYYSTAQEEKRNN